MNHLRDKLSKVHDRVQHAADKAHRDSDDIRVIAVSKTRPASMLRTAFEFGQDRFGENYLQEALQKQQQLSDLAIEWHFIGPIQSNKTRDIATNFDWVHSVDRLKVAQRLNDQRPRQLAPLNVCIQVNIDEESSKSGVVEKDLLSLALAIQNLPHIRLRGLMAIPVAHDTYAEQFAVFKRVQQAFQQLKIDLLAQGATSEHLDTLSMGMSGDMEAAIAAGATFVRIGTDIFGERAGKM